MVNQSSTQLAQTILDDRDGADYYQDPSILADYLAGTLRVTSETALDIANAIIDDRNGANYYADVEILGQYLDGYTMESSNTE